MARIQPLDATDRDGRPFRLRSFETADVPAKLDYLVDVASTTDTILTCADEFGAWTVEGDTIATTNHLADPGTIIMGTFELDDESKETGRILATTTCVAHERRRARHTATIGMSVDAHFRGRGLGRAALEHLIRWAIPHRFIEKLCLCVTHTNTSARTLYESLGFIEEGRRKGQMRLGLPTDPSNHLSKSVHLVDEIMMGRWLCEPNTKHQHLDR